MIKCNYNSLDAGNSLTDILVELDEDTVKESDILNSITSFVKDHIIPLYTIEDVNEVSDTIIGVAEDLDLLGRFPKMFDKSKLNQIINDIKAGKRVDPDSLDTSTENIEEPELVRHRRDASIKFLDNVFGLARNVRDYFMAQHDMMLFDSLFINRGSTDDNGQFLEESMPGPVTGEDLNSNIKAYKEILWDRIRIYLLSQTGLPADVTYTLGHKKLYEIVPDGLGGTKKVYTDVLEELAPVLLARLSVETIKAGDGSRLRELFKLAYNRQDKNKIENIRAKLQLHAYVAYHILNNFDSYLVNKLGKAINVKYFNQLHGEDKYSMSKSTSNLLTTWRDNEEINVEDEADKVTKLLIATTPIYAWGEHANAIGGLYLHFNDFECLISKVKDISFNPEASGILFDEDFEIEHADVWESFSDLTKEVIRGKNLREVISAMRQNPRKYSQVVFDILTSENFFGDYRNTIFKGYSKDERNKLWTIGTQIFGIVKPEIINGQKTGRLHNISSIYLLAKEQSANDYYGYITQTVDSIFKVDYIQYYKDPKSGLIYGRTLYDSTLYKRLREVSEGIRTANSAKRSKSLKLWEQSINLRRIEQSTTTDDNKPILIFKGILFTIPNSGITVKVDKDSGDVKLFNAEGVAIDSILTLINNEGINLFIKQSLRLDLLGNPDLLPTLAEIGDGENSMFLSLINMAARSTMLKYVGYAVTPKQASAKHLSSTTSINDSTGNPETTIQNVFDKETGVKYNWDLNEIDTLHPLDIITMSQIALAKSNLAGDATASVLRDGKGNAQSKNTLSRLLGSVLSQFDLIERRADSATKDSIILSVRKNESGEMESVFEGVYTAKEFDSADNNKEMRLFTAAEMTTANFFFDYIAGLNPVNKTGDNKDDLVGNGIVMFLPSVNSDKNTIGRIKINLNYKVEVGGTMMPLRQLNATQIKSLIAKEFGNTYINILNKVKADLKAVDNEIAIPYPDFVAKLEDGYKDNFATFNLAFYDYKNAKDPATGKFLHPNFAFSDPVSFVKSIVTSYNMETNKPIELIDLVHYSAVKMTDPYTNKKGKGLGFNRVLLSQIARFKPDTARVMGISYTDYPSAADFFARKNKEFLRSALKSKFKISLDALQPESTKKLSDIDYLRSINKGWFNLSGRMVLAKYHVPIEVNGKTYDLVVDITSEADLYKSHYAYEYKANGSRENLWGPDKKAITFTIGQEGGFEEFFADPHTESMLEINPELEKYNLFDYLFSQSFMNATVGSFIAHPDKKFFDYSRKKSVNESGIEIEESYSDYINRIQNLVLEEEAARFLALHKRNVLFTAAMHEFQLNTLNGIPEEYNIAVIDDVHDEQHTFGGESNDIKPFDGATYVNPFIVYLENYSLGGAKAGITKKQFVHFKNGSTGTSGIIKTAGFGMTNDWIRNSALMERMMQKMTDRYWRDADGNEIHNLNIFEKYDGTPLTYPLIFTKVGNVYYLHYIDYDTATGQYNFWLREVSSDGNPKEDWDFIKTEAIDTNYKLWQAFGGKTCVALNDSGFLQYSDNSITSVVKAMNNVGYSKGATNILHLNLKHFGNSVHSIERLRDHYYFVYNDGTKVETTAPEIEALVADADTNARIFDTLNKSAETLDDVYLVLKHSDIHYVPTAGAVKLGAANINSASKFYDKDSELDYLVIKMYLAGIQLDKEHHADDAELSLMTLVISACAAKGFTYEQAVGIYDALARANELNLEDHYEAFGLYFKGKGSSLREVVLKTIIDNLGNSQTGNGNFAELISRDIIERAKKGEGIVFADLMLPLSDNTVYSKIFSIITSYLTKSGIKLKIPGVLAVLTPSYDIMKLHNGKKREKFADDNALLEEQKIVVPHYSREFKFDPTISEFRGYPIVYLAENTEADVAILDGVIYVNPAVIDIKWLKSVESHNINLDNPLFTNKTEYLNYRLLEETLRDKNKLSGLDLTDTALRCLYSNSSDIEVDRTYYITLDTSKFHVDGTGKLAIYPAPDGRLMYVPITEDFANPNLDNCINVKELHWYILTPKQYRRLKKLVDAGLVTSVVEDVIEGRNLGSYNVRGTTKSGKRFQIWDLDSASAAFDLDENKKNITDEFIIKFSNKYLGTNYAKGTIVPLEVKDNWYKNTKIRVNRWLLSDLANLSPSLENSIELYNKFQTKLEEKRKEGVSEQDLMNWEIAWANVKQGRNDGIYYRVGGLLILPTPENWRIIKDTIHNDLVNGDRVRIGGVEEEVDKSTLKQTAYEIIMPKRFKSAFNLDTYADLDAISKDPDFFLKEYANKTHVAVKPGQYTIALKHSDGNHTYVLDRSQLLGKGLHRLSNIIEDTVDGKRVRYDVEGNEMYPMQRASDDMEHEDEIWVDDNGHEIIVTDNIQFYLETLNSDDLLISESLTSAQFDDVLLTLQKVDKRVINRFVRHITKGGRLTIAQDFDEIRAINMDVMTEGTMYDPKYSHILEAMREKHTSFLRSLDIVAARIPAQSMQSFMPMKVVAFENPDLNTAYVSTMLILLLGSDYDIDAVSLECYDIDDNGRLLTWSPLSNLQSNNLLEASFKLPIPTGKDLYLETNSTDEEYDKTIKFFDEFKDVMVVSQKTKWNRETKLDEPTGDISFYFNNTGVRQIEKLAKLLKHLNKNKIYVPNLSNINAFTEYFNGLGICRDLLTPELVRLVFDALEVEVNKHNNYFDKVSKHNLSKIINNYEMYSMYSIISDPVNILQAHMPVDSATGPLKKRAGEDKWVKKDINSRTAGNVINKFESICDNSVGKDGIGITATGLKSFFGMTLFFNTILNSGDATRLRRILLGPKGEGVTIPGIKRKFKTFSNIRPTDPSTVSYEVLRELAFGNLDVDSAVVLSALLSLSTDNAKELALSKLKAGTKTLGMYVYGLSIGMTFDEISKIMMSDVALVLNDVALGDIFNLEDESVRIGRRFWEYFESGPSKLLNKYNRVFTESGTEHRRDTKNENPHRILRNALLYKDDLQGVLNPSNAKKISMGAMLVNLGKNLSMSLTEKLDILDNFRRKGSTNHSAEFIRAYNSLIDDVQQYIIQVHTINSTVIDEKSGSSNADKYKAIKALSEGATELRLVGAIFGLNKGLKTTPLELQSLIDNIRMLIYNRKEEMGKPTTDDDIIDIQRFFYGETKINEETGEEYLDYTYRDLKIADYDEIKCAVNVLDAIVTVPHFLSYFKTLILADLECTLSYKYRLTRELAHYLKKLFHISDQQLVIKSANSYIGRYMTNKFFKSLPANLRFIEIPAGNVAFNKLMQEFTLSEPIVIDLSTDWGQHTFRLWMENEVIPNMQAGHTAPNIKYDENVATNLFIKDLNWDLFRRTTSTNPLIVASLPINMLPRTDTERADFNTYKDAFNLLGREKYSWNTLSYNYESLTLNAPTSHSMGVVDLFTLYSMIADQWLLAENSLVPILEDFLKGGNDYIRKYHEFIDGVDKGTIDIGRAGFNEDGQPTLDFLFAIAPRESYNTSWASIIKATNPKAHKVLFMLKLASNYENEAGADNAAEEANAGDEAATNTFNGFNPNPNVTDLYPSGVVDAPTRTFGVTFGGNTTLITYGPDYKIESIVADGKEVSLSIDKVPITDVIVGPGQTVPVVDEPELAKFIIKEVYKCAS